MNREDCGEEHDERTEGCQPAPEPRVSFLGGARDLRKALPILLLLTVVGCALYLFFRPWRVWVFFAARAQPAVVLDEVSGRSHHLDASSEPRRFKAIFDDDLGEIRLKLTGTEGVSRVRCRTMGYLWYSQAVDAQSRDSFPWLCNRDNTLTCLEPVAGSIAVVGDTWTGNPFVKFVEAPGGEVLESGFVVTALTGRTEWLLTLHVPYGGRTWCDLDPICLSSVQFFSASGLQLGEAAAEPGSSVVLHARVPDETERIVWTSLWGDTLQATGVQKLRESHYSLLNATISSK